MATSGTIRNVFQTGYAVQIAWSVGSQSVANNTSSVTANVQLVSLGSSYTIVSSVTKNGSLTINGTAYSFTFSAALSGNQTKNIFTKTVNVTHNADGSKTCAFSCSAGINVTLSGKYFGNVTASGSGTFNNIARQSSFSSVTQSFTMDGVNGVSVSISRAVSSYKHTLTFTFGSYVQTVTGVDTSTTFVPPVSWLAAVPNGTKGTLVIALDTYSGSTKIGSTAWSQSTAFVPASIVPSISSVTIAEGVDGISAQFGAYVQSKSKLSVSISASGIYGSSITAYKTVIQGVSYTAARFTSGVMTSSGAVSISITVTDSRGATATETRSVNVIAYAPPVISAFRGVRANASGTENYEGTYLSAIVNFAISPVGNKNTKSYKIEYRMQSATTWSTLASGSVYTYNQNYVSTSGFMSPDSQYVIRLTVGDFFSTASAEFGIATAFVLLDFNQTGRGIAFGKVSEMGAFECALSMIAKAGLKIGETVLPEPCAITATLGGTNYKKTSTNDYDVLPMTSVIAYGSRLTRSGNGVLIGKDVKKIRVSAQICYGAATAGLKTCAIWTSAATSHIARTQMNITNASIPESIVISPKIYAVSAGDLITLRAHGTANDIIYGGLMQTYLTVEVVE